MAIQDIKDAVLSFNGAKVEELVKAEASAGTDLDAILNDGLIGALDEVGQKFSQGLLFVPEMMMAAKAMKSGLGELKPLLSDDAADGKGTVVIGTVKGDQHDIGKNLVSMMLEAGGFNVVDLGVDVDVDRFVREAQKSEAKVVALSALLTTTMPAMAETVKAIKEAGLTAKTIIGGAPVSQAYAENIGADGYGEDAPGAVALARKFVVS